jgi:hypothetical protein
LLNASFEKRLQRGIFMLSRRNAFTVALVAVVGVAAPALAATKTSRATPFDTDNDGTVDVDEAKKAAGELFDKLDTDKEALSMSRS